MAFTPAQQIEYRKKLKAKGVCIRCCKTPAVDGFSTCSECLEYCRVMKAKRMKDGKLCHDCLTELDAYTLVTNGVRCLSCHEKYIDSGRRRRAIGCK